MDLFLQLTMLLGPDVAQVNYMLIFHMCFVQTSWLTASLIKWIFCNLLDGELIDCSLNAPAELRTIHFPLEYVYLPELFGYRIVSTIAKARLNCLLYPC
jgi:hypothetical protein